AASAALRWPSPSFCRRCWSTRSCSTATSRLPPPPNHNRYCNHTSNAARATSTSFSPRIPGGARSALQRHEGVATGVLRGRAQLLLDAQQLVVLGDAVAAAQRAGLDLGGGGGHCDVGDRGVLGLAGTVRHDRRVLRRIGH